MVNTTYTIESFQDKPISRAEYEETVGDGGFIAIIVILLIISGATRK